MSDFCVYGVIDFLLKIHRRHTSWIAPSVSYSIKSSPTSTLLPPFCLPSFDVLPSNVILLVKPLYSTCVKQSILRCFLQFWSSWISCTRTHKYFFKCIFQEIRNLALYQFVGNNSRIIHTSCKKVLCFIASWQFWPVFDLGFWAARKFESWCKGSLKREWKVKLKLMNFQRYQ